MKTRNQIILALVLVLGAAGVVTVRALGGASDEATQGGMGGMEGHDHSAMAAGQEEEPNP